MPLRPKDLLNLFATGSADTLREVILRECGEKEWGVATLAYALQGMVQGGALQAYAVAQRVHMLLASEPVSRGTLFALFMEANASGDWRRAEVTVDGTTETLGELAFRCLES